MAPVPPMDEHVVELQTATATEYLQALAASEVLAGVETRTEVAFGQLAPFLLETIESYGIDLVVLGSHGRTGLSRWALGIVAHMLVHHGTVPILVLRQGESLVHAGRTRPLCALVPLDGSALSEAALAPAAHIAAALAAPAEGTLQQLRRKRRLSARRTKKLPSVPTATWRR